MGVMLYPCMFCVALLMDMFVVCVSCLTVSVVQYIGVCNCDVFSVLYFLY